MKNGCRLSREGSNTIKTFKDLVDYGDIKRLGISMRSGTRKSESERARRIGVGS